jgi:IMP dehydrogenase/GMP reductase
MKNKTKFDFDDILIEPAFISSVNSRYHDITLPDMLPIIAAPMDTVVNMKNMDIFINNKLGVVLPRQSSCFDAINPNKFIFTSLGLEDITKYFDGDSNLSLFPNNFKLHIDTANGNMLKIIEYCKRIKAIRSDIIIMVGNIANPETYRQYAESESVDYIKCGVGNGNACITTKKSSIGFPMASLIHETYQLKEQMIYNQAKTYCMTPFESHKITKYPKIVADGGMKDYSDIIKALALGADMIIVGSIFNKAIESCGSNYFHGIKVNQKLAEYLFDRGFTIKKYFRGMSTKEAQKAMGKTNIKTSEGVIRYRKAEYHLQGWVENMNHYLRSAMSYCDTHTLEEFIGKVNIIKITAKAYDRFNK